MGKLPLFNRFSKKFSFALIAIFVIMLIPIILIGLSYSSMALLCALIASDFSVLLITVTYLTGQAKVDFQATANAQVGVKNE